MDHDSEIHAIHGGSSAADLDFAPEIGGLQARARF